ncbi:MAG: hypothetical protein N3A62_08740 [Thermodesulfovibrionales bacterium]|nr:hypothetical protein [Thermodesulfovibrionales bacterium]
MRAENNLAQTVINQYSYVQKDGQSSNKSAQQGSNTNNSTTRQETEDKVSINSKKDSLQEQKIQQIVQRLKAIEEKVKAHERAHKSAGGQFTGPVSYTYTTGPDGKRYITGGEVPIQIVEGKTPEETIRNMEIVRRAALAPADPSPQDRAVAAQATQIEQRARVEQAKLRAEEQKEKYSKEDNPSEIPQNTENQGNTDTGGRPINANNNSRGLNEYKKSKQLMNPLSVSLFA